MKIQPIRAGSNPSLTVQLFDADTDAALPLTGYTPWSASAKHTLSGTVVNFASAVIQDAASGKVKLDYSVSAFTETGVYSIDLVSVDPTGKTVNFPYERASLLMRVDAAN